MAWLCTGKTNAELIANMQSAGLIHSTRVAESIGYNATISAPHMHAHVAELLLPYLKPGSSALDVGSGSGYMLSVFHHLTNIQGQGEQGHVVGVEHLKELADFSVANMEKDGLQAELASKRITVVTGDGRDAPTVPEALVQQLKSPGRLIVPVDNPATGIQDLLQIDKSEQGEVKKSKLFGVMSSDTAYAPTESVIAHLMPFSIDYTGPAPVDTFFLSQPIDAESGDGSSEAVSAFRGRRVYGTRLELPESYRLGFFCVQEETITDETKQEPAPSKQRKQAKTRPVQPPVPVRGSRFALDDEDEDEGEAYDVGVPFGEPREPLSEDDDYGDVSRLSTQLAPTKHSLRPVADAGSSLWVWGPDGPIDAGDDAYIRTCNEWLQVIAPSLHDFTL
ncbi:hypothetical protein CBS14141_002892 [Malassezia furfur]|nr:hypothetical protein CBS14141_002892 [Malassezia furfur]